jgi:hypothetical protein
MTGSPLSDIIVTTPAAGGPRLSATKGGGDVGLPRRREDDRPEGYWSALLRVFRGPGRYGPFIAGSWVANIGRWFLNLAAAVLVYELSRSTLLVGAVSVAQFTANIGLGPAAATVVFLLFVLAVATVRPQEHRPPPQGRVRSETPSPPQGRHDMPSPCCRPGSS